MGSPDSDIRIASSLYVPESLIGRLNREYPIAPTACSLLHRGFNDSYLVHSKSGHDYVLRVYAHGWRSWREVETELCFLRHLVECGIEAADAVGTRKRESIIELPAPEGVRFAVLFDRAPGNIPPVIDGAMAEELGSLLADLHLAGRGFKREADRKPLDWPQLVVEPLAYLRHTFADEFADELRALDDVFAEAHRRVEASGAFDARGMLHGDFINANILTTGPARYTVIDFDFCGPGPLAVDVGAFKWGLLVGQPDDAAETFERFAQAYVGSGGDGRAVAGADEFVLVRRLWVWYLNTRFDTDFRRLNPLRARRQLDQLMDRPIK